MKGNNLEINYIGNQWAIYKNSADCVRYVNLALPYVLEEISRAKPDITCFVFKKKKLQRDLPSYIQVRSKFKSKFKPRNTFQI